MFNFFKKKEAGNKTVKEAEKEEVEKKEEEYEDRMNKNIAVHVMPEKFRFVNPQSQKAKRAGSAIIISGIVFIIVAGVLIYFYFFNATEKKEESLDVAKDSEIYNEEEEKESSGAKEEGLEGGGSSTTTEEWLYPSIEPNTPTTTDETTEPKVDSKATSTLSGITTTVKDSDEDGLFDKEEILLGCNISIKDSDRDGYDDLAELINFYDPTGKGKLVDNENILEYYNKTFNYNVYYPLGWQKISMGGEDSVMFKSDDNSFFQIIVRPNVDNQLVDDWYKKQFEIDKIDDEKIIDTDSWHGLKSDDELVIYLSDNKNEYLFVLTYGPEVDDVLVYKNIFDMFIKSFNIES